MMFCSQETSKSDWEEICFIIFIIGFKVFFKKFCSKYFQIYKLISKYKSINCRACT